ncbi:hypothetical protein PYCCODRAFT_1454148 [Trametes coccinea BRFM310]|uniref:HMG box domain-containing protein n=1 Tax=Trametes coccinea (strain BRFM310) TaxID=1353009 RepID=A0A1Y2ICJ0_TRAC3|nr:hypothetical protein PYCCODRAFT_1454148 [Trametes coccinea BRFM310]
MLSRLATRVFTRAYASPLSFSAAGAARTLITTAPVAARTRKAATQDASEEPAATRKPAKAKSAEATAEAKLKAKAKKEKEKEKLAAAKAKAAAAKKKAAEAAAKAKKAREEALKNDPNARFRHGLKSVKLRAEEKPPKGPAGPYCHFLKDTIPKLRAEGLPEGKDYQTVFLEASRKVAELWKNMSEEEKKPYVAMHEADRARYDKEVEEWYRKTDPRIVKACSVQKIRLGDKPADLKRPSPPFSQFTKELFHTIEAPAEARALEVGKYRMQRLGEMWRDMPEEEKARRNAAYKQACVDWQQRFGVQAQPEA